MLNTWRQCLDIDVTKSIVEQTGISQETEALIEQYSDQVRVIILRLIIFRLLTSSSDPRIRIETSKINITDVK